ncbi:MAG: glycosyltransferase family 39 protein [Campylobacterales bacterium]|nr:glycosyltransferase family 39 protein [Campylobacterales bacterium]
MNLLAKEHQPLFILITFVAVFRLLIAPHLGLGADEAHYLIYALNLDYSYFDHPPLVGWTQYIFTSIFGINEFGARISAITIGFLSSYFLYRLLYEIDNNAHFAFVGVLALQASFIFNALFLMLMPDTLLFLFIIPLMYAVLRLEKSSSLSNWLFLGVLLGLCGLSKYTAILFIVPIVIYFVFKKRYDIFYNPKIVLSIALALLIISPVIYWNIQNDWISFHYQSNHVVAQEQINLKGFAASLSAQFFAYNPLLTPIAFYGLYRSFRSKNNLLLLSSFFGSVLFLFFTYSALYKTALPHWSALFYLLFIPIGVYFLYAKSLKWKKYLKFAIGFGLTISALIYIEIATKLIPLPDENSIQLDIYGFEKIMQRANEQIKDPKKEAIAVTLWTLASRAIVYNAEYNSEVFLIDDRYDQFDIWEKSSALGKDLVFIDINFAHKDINATMRCNSVYQVESFALLQGSEAENIKLIKCINFQGLK